MKRRLFSRAQHLLHSTEFNLVKDQGRRAGAQHFVLLGLDNAHGFSRLGLIVSRKVGNAVRRNSVKRKIREWFRSEGPGPTGMDLVVIARRGADSVPTDQVASELSRASKRLQNYVDSTAGDRDSQDV